MKKNISLLKIVLAVSSLVLAIAMISVQIKTSELKKEQSRLDETLESYQNAITEMEQDLLLPREEYIEKYLREALGYHRSVEIIFRDAD